MAQLQSAIQIRNLQGNNCDQALHEAERKVYAKIEEGRLH